MKIAVLAIMILSMFALVGTSMAVPSGKTVEFAGEKGPGKVIFDGKIHADKGLKCNDCHTKLFKMKKGAEQITKADHEAGKLCFSCHNGTKAFTAANNCTKCHKK